MEKGKMLNLLQIQKAERFVAVAAASVLARGRFLARLSQLSTESGFDLPKGASTKVIEAGKQIVNECGRDALRTFAKLHFKTTASILEKR
jgi:ribonuclease HIII